MADQHDHVLALDEVLVLHVGFAFEDLGAALVGECGLHRDEFVANDAHQARARAQDVEIVGDLGGELVQRLGDFVAAERGQAREAQFEDRARLRVRQADRAVLGDARGADRRSALTSGAMSRAGQTRSISATRAAPESGEVRIRRITSSILATAIARPTWICAASRALVEQIFGAPGDDFLAEVEEGDQHVLQRQHLRPAAVQRDHVGAEARLHRGEAPELIEHDVGDRVALQLDDDAHAVAIGFVAQIRDALDASFRARVRRSSRSASPC